MSLRLLVAEDNVDAADSLAILLRLEGYVVVTAYDGRQAVEKALAFHPDVLGLDIGMPLFNGYQVAQRLRALPEFERKLFIALTGYSDQKHLDQASSVRFDEYLVKPLHSKTLLGILADLVRNGPPLSLPITDPGPNQTFQIALPAH